MLDLIHDGLEFQKCLRRAHDIMFWFCFFAEITQLVFGLIANRQAVRAALFKLEGQNYLALVH